MKLTKQKLEQLIMEEYVRSISDEGKPTKYPEYADKLTNLAKDDYPQARELADALDEPIDVELSSDDFMEFIPFGIRQFEQVSPVTTAARNLGTLLDPGIVEIFFDTQDNKWVVAYYKETGPERYQYVGKHSKEYSEYESKKAIRHYNSLADRKFVKRKPLKDRAESYETSFRNKLKKST